MEDMLKYVGQSRATIWSDLRKEVERMLPTGSDSFDIFRAASLLAEADGEVLPASRRNDAWCIGQRLYDQATDAAFSNKPRRAARLRFFAHALGFVRWDGDRTIFAIRAFEQAAVNRGQRVIPYM